MRLLHLWSALTRRLFPRPEPAPTPILPQPPPSPLPILPEAAELPALPRVHRIALALQGGGAHGAFTWGVLDRLMEEPSLEVVGVSGASAGAMNGAMLVQGLGRNGRDGAKDALATFWHRVSLTGAAGTTLRTLFMPPGFSAPVTPKWGGWERGAGVWGAGAWMDMLRRLVTPYDFQPADWHPLRPLLGELLDIPALRNAGIRLFISACNVKTGALRLFNEGEVGVDHLLASACLPHLFQAVQIDGEDYWDGGYLANPALFPLLTACPNADLVLISINPFTCPDRPRTPEAIADRLSQITFNAPLRRELLEIDSGRLPTAQGIRRHHIQADDAMRQLNGYSKLNADWGFLSALRDLGRQTAAEWLAANAGQLGNTGTMPLTTDPVTPMTI